MISFFLFLFSPPLPEEEVILKSNFLFFGMVKDGEMHIQIIYIRYHVICICKFYITITDIAITSK